MSFNFNKLSVIFDACRFYSTPISIMSWIVPFLLGAFSGGNLFFGLLGLLGIIILHMASNIFDDAIDYTSENIKIKKGLKKDFNFQKGKCKYIFTNELSLKQYYIISFILFLCASLIGLFFLYVIGYKLLYVIIPTAVLCLLYPILGGLGLGEIFVAIIFSPMLYSGVYLIMTGTYNTDILILSISTGLLVVSVLHNHMIMDYKLDKKNRKITLCRLCGSEKKALALLGFIISAAYLNLAICIIFGKFSLYYLIPFLSLPYAIKLYKDMCKEHTDFISKFLLPEKLLSLFILLLCISITADRVL